MTGRLTDRPNDQFDDAHRNDVKIYRIDFEIATIPFHNYIYAFSFITIYGNERLSNCQQKRRGNNNKYKLLKNNNNNSSSSISISVSNNSTNKTLYHPFRDPKTNSQNVVESGLKHLLTCYVNFFGQTVEIFQIKQNKRNKKQFLITPNSKQ